MKRLLIDGKLVEAERTFASLNPATGEVLDQAPDATTAQAAAAVEAARRAFDTTSWSTDVEFRIRCLDQLHRALVEHREELRELTMAEVGATRINTHGPQLDEPIEQVRYYADLLRTYPLTEEIGDAEIRGQIHRRWVEKEAAGVVAAIIPYNYPTQLALAKMAPALAAGCTVVLKGAPDTPLITLALGELIAEHTDIPAGVVNVLTSSEVAVGEVLTTHPEVDVVTFTGSTATGRRIMAAAGDTIKRVFLELGGKSALILLDDADFTAAAPFAGFAVCSHAGQGCAINTRLLVPRHRHDEAVRYVAAVMEKVTYGDPTDPKNFMGPLISERQRDKVDGMVQRAVAAGATLVMGGKKIDPGFFYAPTCWPTSTPTARSPRRRSSGPCWPSSPSRTTTTPCASPTTRSTACPAGCAAPTRNGLWRWPGGSAPAR